MTQIVGILQMAGRGGEVYADGKNDIGTVYIHPGDLNGAPFGMKVVVELTSPIDAENHTGKIIEVLGDPSRPDVAMQGIIRMHGLSEEFPDEVIAQAKQVPSTLDEDTIASEINRGRTDLRYLKTITIDGIDARDLDDAISIETLDNGWRLWIHIADVAEYVKENTPMDVEALARGNSVYLADRVLPMLPPQLSNGICSINPGVDRFSMTACIDFDKEGLVIDGDIMEAVIKSDLRANYDDILKTIETETAVEGYEDMLPEIFMMRDLAQVLEKNSEGRGALEFDFPETKIVMGKDGEVVDIYPERQTFANELIEQFMIVANRFVAKKFSDLELPFLYRVHEAPNQEKLDIFRSLVKRQGVNVKISHDPQPKELADLLLALRDMPGAESLQTLLLRSLAKAEYLADPIGHYGLALHDYSHFTAPIRRYSDLFIHRVIKGFLRADSNIKVWQEKAKAVALQCSLRERVAIAAERDSVDQKIAEYYAKRIGEVYDAEVTGFVGAGMFVRLPSSAEGMVPFRTMNDFYVYDEVTMTAQGKGSKRVFRIGDHFQVQVVRVDTVKRQVDFEVVDEEKAGVVDMAFQQASHKEKKALQSGRSQPKSRGKRRSEKTSKDAKATSKSKSRKPSSLRKASRTSPKTKRNNRKKK